MQYTPQTIRFGIEAEDMATLKDWLNQKFIEWEKAQGRSQSYYAFARYLEVTQSGLSQWMTGGSVPAGEDLLNLASKLGPEIYDVLGTPRPGADAKRMSVSLIALPADIRKRLTSALNEIEQNLRQQRLHPDSPEARQITLNVLSRWGFPFTE
jgi:transcriptional regulator with XRE-family HTH domain